MRLLNMRIEDITNIYITELSCVAKGLAVVWASLKWPGFIGPQAYAGAPLGHE
jgi:hypothetical protein